jgi:hypothetical protein
MGMLVTASAAAASLDDRVLPPDTLPADYRLGALRDLDGYFPYEVPASREAWQTRAEQVRQQLQASLGLWPQPTKTPLNPVVHGMISFPDYTVEKVYFESMPGFYVTGNLYRPVGKSVVGQPSVGKPGPRPAVLSPHGHWANGRFYDAGRDGVRTQIVQGAERFEDSGRNPLQARCVQLARMGCIVFHWDMLGYADSQQISQDIIHGFRKQRPEMNQSQDWGLFSPQAESRSQSAMGLQAWNSIRALDFILSLPDVDAKRIGVTGASGGGTQSFILAALDPRVQVAFPAVMVSTAMQGGCTCENACGLRIGTGNIEIAAMFAPKPLGMTGANDWTKEMSAKGYPELQAVFRLLGAPDNVKLFPFNHFDHNYNYVSRAAMYSWFNKHLQLGWEEPVVEEDYHRLTADELTVWDAQHPRPAGGPDFERQLLAWWATDAQRQVESARPGDATALDTYQKLVRNGLAGVLRPLDASSENVTWQLVGQGENSGYVVQRGLLNRRITPQERIGFSAQSNLTAAQEQLPIVVVQPKEFRGRTCVLIASQGKQVLWGTDGQLAPPIRKLLDAGIRVCGVDLLYQGEFLSENTPLQRVRRVENQRDAAAYTFGYNPSVCAERIHDIVTLVNFLKQGEFASQEIDLLAHPGAGHWAAAARAQLGSAVTRLAVDTAGFRFAQVSDIFDPDFLPGGAKYDDLPGMLAVAAPGRLFVAGETEGLPPVVSAAYQASGDADAVQTTAAQGQAVCDAAIEWLLKNS